MIQLKRYESFKALLKPSFSYWFSIKINSEGEAKKVLEKLFENNYIWQSSSSFKSEDFIHLNSKYKKNLLMCSNHSNLINYL